MTHATSIVATRQVETPRVERFVGTAKIVASLRTANGEIPMRATFVSAQLHPSGTGNPPAYTAGGEEKQSDVEHGRPSITGAQRDHG